jgi:hypothetical protein
MPGEPDRRRTAELREARRRFRAEELASWHNERMTFADLTLAEQVAIVRNYLLVALLFREWPGVADAAVHLEHITDPGQPLPELEGSLL